MVMVVLEVCSLQSAMRRLLVIVGGTFMMMVVMTGPVGSARPRSFIAGRKVVMMIRASAVRW